MKTLRLDNSDLEEEFFEDTRLAGIVTTLKDYQFCWQLNHRLRFDFRNNNDIEIQLNKKKRDYFFTVFEYREPNISLTHYLYNNQFDGEYLLPEFKHINFLWLMKGEKMENERLADILNSMKSINGVQLVTELTNEKIRNKAHLIF
ncbi:MAG TPA: IPExxxVDY family protein [Flavitalea sp.]|nr:IPExxxVDY family protein [Flavitalea sp.]